MTAVAIVVVTPEIGAWLERGKPPAEKPRRWTRWVASLTRQRSAAALWVLLLALPMVAVAVGLGPRLADAIVAMRPEGLMPLQVQQQIYDAFGGRTGQWVVMVRGDDAHERNDRIAEALVLHAEHIESVDTLSTMIQSSTPRRLSGSKADWKRLLLRTSSSATSRMFPLALDATTCCC